MLKEILNPDLYHGDNKKAGFFEGWYFKIVTKAGDRSFAFIPGIFKSRNQENSHSFIQFLNGDAGRFNYIKYKSEEFIWDKSRFYVKVHNSDFSLESININIIEPEVQVQGILKFLNRVKWPDSVLNPGSMGFYNYLLFMQCYSQVCAMDLEVQGSLRIMGEEVDFTGGKAYVEKNWGRDFPYSYIWVQCNSFPHSKTALSCSIGHIPMPKPLKSFTGFLIGFYHEGEFYKFSTINRSKINIKAENKEVEIQVDNGAQILSFATKTDKSTYMELLAPREKEMIPIASETIIGECNVKLIDKAKNHIIFQGHSPSSGVEFSGNYEGLNIKSF